MFTDQELENTAAALQKQSKHSDEELRDAVKVLMGLANTIGRLEHPEYRLMARDMRHQAIHLEGFIEARKRR